VCIFEVSGTINLSSHLQITDPYITVAGQTAPSPGITLKGYTLIIKSHDVLVQHIRVRVGAARAGADGIQMNAGNDDVYNVVIDHCSVSWATDENVSTYSNSNTILDNITISNSIISEGMKAHESFGYTSGGSVEPLHVSFYGNLFAHNVGRNPRLQSINTTVVNNYVYNWENMATDLGGDTVTYDSLIGNYYKPGPDSKRNKGPIYVRSTTPSGTELYLDDNACPYYGSSCLDDNSGVILRSTAQVLVPNLNILPSIQVEAYIVDNSGARPKDRDAVDSRLINEMLAGTGGIPHTEADVGGWPTLAENHRPLTIPSNPNGDDDGDGYTHLEAWLHTFAAEVEGGTPALSPTFSDVPFDHWAHDEIEALYRAGYTSGCSTDPLMFCPETAMTRAESAVFVERGLHGATFTPPNPSSITFTDVPLSEWFAKWADALWSDGYTAGCGTDPLIYCPLQGHTRTEGTVFYLRMLNGAAYVPPDPTGLFSDVAIENWGAKWIEAAYLAGLIQACETSPGLMFCPDAPFDRATAAHMMVQAKGLNLQ
jgi:pectate lyase